MLTLKHYINNFKTEHSGEIFEALYLTDSRERQAIARAHIRQELPR